MTEQEKTIIHNLQEQNFNYVTIAKDKGVTVATVKSYSQRSGLAGNHKEAFSANPQSVPVLPTFCRRCCKQIVQKEKVKPRIFCRDGCRATW